MYTSTDPSCIRNMDPDRALESSSGLAVTMALVAALIPKISMSPDLWLRLSRLPDGRYIMSPKMNEFSNSFKNKSGGLEGWLSR